MGSMVQNPSSRGFWKMDFEMILFKVEHLCSSALKPDACEIVWHGLEARRFLGSR